MDKLSEGKNSSLDKGFMKKDLQSRNCLSDYRNDDKSKRNIKRLITNRMKNVVKFTISSTLAKQYLTKRQFSSVLTKVYFARMCCDC